MPNVKNAKDSQAPQAAQAPEWEVVNRVVYPVKDQDLTMPLYVVEWTRPHLTDAVFDPRVDIHRIDFQSMNPSGFQRLVNESVVPRSNVSAKGVFIVDGRNSMTVQPGRHVSLCTFFNAFPASYWKRWTRIDAVRFTARVKGRGEITVFKSSGRGLFSPVQTIAVDSAENFTTVEAVIPMTGLIDGGYFWFDAESADDAPLTVEEASWAAPRAARTADHPTKLSIAITTFNRAPYCMNQLRTIAAEQSVRERLDTIYCTDQGTDLVQNQPGFDEVSEELGSQLTYIRQANMGGSGGFSRGMYETVRAGRSDYVLLLDDDAISEPEAIVRAVQFSDYVRTPMLVGGGMLHLDNRTVLYTQGERFNMATMWMYGSQGLGYNHDFASSPLRDASERHRRIDTDYNGWWMCLIPAAVIRDIGLSLPVFIKFDDMEYAIRAREHGYPSVCLPGVAVWHQAWHDKDPSRTWEEYFFQRNRWICALLHCRKPSLRFAYEMLYGDVNVGLKFVYSALKLRHMGLVDIMRGPGYIVDSMPGKLAEVRKAREGFADTTVSKDQSDFPEPKREFVSRATPKTSRAVQLDGLKAIAKAVVSRGDGTHDETPDIAIPAKDAIWRSFVGVNSALVTSPDGNSVSWCRRDSKLYRRELREGLALSRRLLRDWERLSKAYRNYDMASMKVWERVFEETSADRD
ncbi:glycosyltransferase [Bifidobacterium avesanii]|nr:glycosyltransferase [Bifidobacterium avesanii]